MAKGFTPVFECAKEACGPSFVVLKYRWDRKETQVHAAGYDGIRGHLITAAFDELNDVRYALMKKADGGRKPMSPSTRAYTSAAASAPIARCYATAPACWTRSSTQQA